MDRVHAVEPAKAAFSIKADIRRAVEAEGIPYTFVSANFFVGFFLPTLFQIGATAPPRDNCYPRRWKPKRFLEIF